MNTARQKLEQSIKNSNTNNPAPQAEAQRQGQTVLDEIFIRWLEKGQDVWNRKGVIDLHATFEEKLQFLLHGKPYIIEHEDDGDTQENANIADELGLQYAMMDAEAVIYNQGASYLVIDKLANDKVNVSIAEKGFPNYVVVVGGVKVKASVWTTIMFDRTKYFMNTIYTLDKILTTIYNKQPMKNGTPNIKGVVALEEVNKLLPKEMKIDQEVDNPFGFIPVVVATYRGTKDYSIDGLAKLAPKLRIDGIQQKVDDGIEALSTELYLNRSKILADQDMLDKSQLSTIAREHVLGLLKNTGGIDGEAGKPIEILQADPKVDQYWTNIKNYVSMGVQTLKLSELSTDGSSTATGEVFDKANDVETANTLQVFRQRVIAEILEKARAMKQGEKIDEWDIDTSKWSVQLIPNVIMNEAKMTEIVLQQLGGGLINMVQAKVKLEGISKQDAQVSLNEVANDKYDNPTKNATNAFNQGNEEFNNEDTSGNEELGVNKGE